MMVLPSLDLLGGRAVQLVGGDPSKCEIVGDDPIAVARFWESEGAEALHVVDLDAALGIGSNGPLVRRVLRETDLRIQAGGGIRSLENLRRVFADGAWRAVVGTSAIKYPELVREMAVEFPDRVIVALDIRGGKPTTDGWRRTESKDWRHLLKLFGRMPLAATLCTVVETEGRLAGPAFGILREMVSISRLPVIASGGVVTLSDLAELKQVGAAAAIVGKALYRGNFTLRQAKEMLA